jgi:hypothetical protein
MWTEYGGSNRVMEKISEFFSSRFRVFRAKSYDFQMWNNVTFFGTDRMIYE